LAGGDVLKWNAVTEMNVLEFMTALSFLREKVMEEQRVTELEMKKYHG